MSATKYLKVIAHILKMERIITLYSSRFQPAREAQDKVVEQWQRSIASPKQSTLRAIRSGTQISCLNWRSFSAQTDATTSEQCKAIYAIITRREL